MSASVDTLLISNNVRSSLWAADHVKHELSHGCTGTESQFSILSPTPLASNLSIISPRCRTERVKRSSFVTITLPPLTCVQSHDRGMYNEGQRVRWSDLSTSKPSMEQAESAPLAPVPLIPSVRQNPKLIGKRSCRLHGELYIRWSAHEKTIRGVKQNSINRDKGFDIGSHQT